MSQRKDVTLILAGSTIAIITVLTLIDAAALSTEAQSSASSPQTQSTNRTVVDPSISNQEQSSSSSTYQPEISPTVKISSPQKGQKVPIGELDVHGISSDTSDTDCEVFVILNDVKPYQPVSPSGSSETEGSIGDSGERDYSKWEYSLTPSYALIKEGENKITSKILCQNDEGTPSPVSSNLKHYSVNVTGFENNNSTNSNYTASPSSSLSTMNTSYISSPNGTVFIIPVPEDLLSSASQANNPDNNEASDTDDGEDTTNNGPNQDDNGDSEEDGKGKGKAKGHSKNKG